MESAQKRSRDQLENGANLDDTSPTSAPVLKVHKSSSSPLQSFFGLFQHGGSHIVSTTSVDSVAQDSDNSSDSF